MELLLVVFTLAPKHSHALESLAADDEHGEANAGIEGAGATVYVRQNAEALLGLPDNALKQLSALQPAVASVGSKTPFSSANKIQI